MERPDFFTLKNGEKVKLPFSNQEYHQRVSNLRSVIKTTLFRPFGICFRYFPEILTCNYFKRM